MSTSRPKHLYYLANNRLPTEKAHGLQIVQMCEALADTSYTVTLVTPRRINTPEMRAVRSLWAYYGVVHNFAFRRLPCLDLIRWFPGSQVAFLLQTVTYLLALVLWLLSQRPDVLYTRDLFVGLIMALTRPRTPLIYEVHQVHNSRWGQWVQGFIVRRAYTVPITQHLAEKMRALGAKRVLVAPDGFRSARFADMPTRDAAKTTLGIAPDTFVLGYVGQLHTMGMTKGVDLLIEAVARLPRPAVTIDLLLVGGPEASITTLREQWTAHGLPPERLHTVGQVPSTAVPRYLAAMDAGTMPLPRTEHFAYYASPLKLFEYMAAGCAVLASDLPSTAEIVRHGTSALLFPSGDVAAFATAIQQCYANRDLLAHIRSQAQIDVQAYSWTARAARIVAVIDADNH